MPSSFITPLRTETLDDGTDILIEQFIYALGREDSPVRIIVPIGFPTDFASVPRLLRWLIDAKGRHAKPAVLHDYIYRTQIVARVVADAIFLESMEVKEVARWQRWLIYLAVRCFGWIAWHNNKKRGLIALNVDDYKEKALGC